MLQRIKASFANLTGSDVADRHNVMMRNLTDAHVRCHLAIVDQGSFRTAAAALGISEPTLHRAARGLEAVVDTPLYRRGPYGVAATAAAIRFSENLRLALKEIEQGLDELAAAQGFAGGRLSIGCLPLMPKQVLARAVGELLRRHPDVAISLEEGSRESLTRVLSNGGVDMLLGALRRTPSAQGLSDRRLFADPYVIVVRAKHPLASRTTVSVDELATFPWVIPWRETPRREVLEQLFARFSAPPKIVMETSSLPMMSAMLADNDCITILSRSQISGRSGESEPASTGLKVLPLLLDWQDRSVGITTRADWLPTPIQQDFISLLGPTE
ncbi:MAG: LysR family transcriptional regulator [Caulobacteraceae bacterium]